LNLIFSLHQRRLIDNLPTLSESTSMKRQTLLLAAICSLAFTLNASAAVLYVDLNSTNPLPPYSGWSTAATNIQDAVDAANPGDQVLVTNGVYQNGGSGGNKVTVNKPIKVQSVNGPAVTVIDGAGAMRCVYLSAGGATLAGFTLTHGFTSGNGGGVCCPPSGATVSNCVVTANSAQHGGGVFCGALNNCVITGNSANNDGGGFSSGAFSCTLNNCMIVSNYAGNFAGGAYAYSGGLNNCTIVGNYAVNNCGGSYGGTLNNCIIYYNAIGSYGYPTNTSGGTLNYCCTTPLASGSGNITKAPGFVDLADGNLRLQIGSPCINAGTNASAPAGTDLDGNPRIVNGTVDMGAYENQYSGTVHYVSLNSTNPVPPYTNWITAATNIQDAVGAALAGEYVVADAGVYNVGGTVVYGQETNRVALTNAITLLSVYGPQMTTIVGGTQTRCVYVGSNAALSGFMLTNGQTRNGGDAIKEQSGGGIWGEVSGAVTNCWIVGNSASYFSGGGGAYGAAFYNCTLSNNLSSGFAGGAYQSKLVNCRIISNSAYFSGGGTYAATLYNCTLNGNSDYYSGGGACAGILYNCRLTGNRAVNGEGGGVSGAILYNCTLSSNSASYYGGGGASGCTLYNCILEGNQSQSLGGGSLKSTLYNCTVTGNAAVTGGGGVAGCTLSNCIVYFNSSPNGSNWNASGFGPISLSYMSYCCTAPDPLSGPGNVTNDPSFVDPIGGVFHLKCGSPCIDAGTDLSAIITNDLAGNLRPLDGNGDGIAKFDMGAYEYNPAIDQIPVIRVAGGFTNFATSYPVLFVAEIGGCADYFWWDFGDGVTVTNQSPVSHAWASPGQYNVRLSAYYSTLGQSLTATTRVQVVQSVYYVDLNSPSPTFPYTNWTTAAQNIQDAVGAGTTPGRLVLVADGIYRSTGVIVYGQEYNNLALTNPVVVQSVNGPGTTTIQPLNWVWGRCVYVGNNAILSGFTLTGGNTRSGGDIYKEQSGGGVWCEPGGVVSNCVVAGNVAYYYGGGAYQGTFYNCVFSGNLAVYYGGGASQGAFYNCIFTNNSIVANTAQGGGVFGGTLHNCTIISNWPATRSLNTAGAGVSQSTLYNCILTCNTAESVPFGRGLPVGMGGGAYLSTLYNCTVSSNWALSGGGAYASTLYGCTLSGNRASSYGGGAFSNTLYNCTVFGNSAGSYGGGAFRCALTNSIVYFNTASSFSNWYSGKLSWCCTTPLPPDSDNITGDPVFVDAAFHLSAASPCRGAGSSLYATGTDMDGEAWNSPPSMGADEVYDADFIGALSVAIQSPQTNLLVNHSLALAGQITGRAAGLEWSFDDGTILTNVSYFTSHEWTNPGDYSVVFTAYNTDHPGGVSTNLLIHVLPLVPPWLQPSSFTVSPDGFQFQFDGQADAIYTVQVATNLIPPIVWQDLQTITSTGGVVQVTDPNAPNGTSFYRVGVQ
jgi:hypothetical protein